MVDHGDLVRASARTVWMVLLANLCFGIALLTGLAASGLLGERFTVMLLGGGAGVDLDARTNGMRWLMVLGLAVAVATHVLVGALRRVIGTVSTGDPFIVGNAARLRTIGWSLLIIQLLDIPAAVIARAYPALGAAAPDAGVSPAGWLAVLMTFVLARVFVVGARLRDDLEGVV